MLNITPIVGNAGICPTQAAAVTAAYKKYAAAHPQAASEVANVAGNGSTSGDVSALSAFDPKLPTH